MLSLRNREAWFGRMPHGLVLLTLALSILASPVHAQLLINEVLSAPARDWNGDGEIDFKNDEWVEILNAGSAPVDLTGLYLKDATGDAYHYGFSGTLMPGEVLLVLGSDAVAWQAANDAGSTGLSLNNGGDTVELWRDVEFPRVLQVLDAVPITAHAAGSDRALGRLPESLDWVLFDELNPYSGDLLPLGTLCSPSPGGLNVCSAVPAEESSFGYLKSMHFFVP
jgi:hypothetical protein